MRRRPALAMCPPAMPPRLAGAAIVPVTIEIRAGGQPLRLGQEIVRADGVAEKFTLFRAFLRKVAPLNADSDMYWPWGSQYLFVRLGQGYDAGRFKVPSLRNVAVTGPYSTTEPWPRWRTSSISTRAAAVATPTPTRGSTPSP